MRRLLWAASVVLGCSSYATLHGARTLAPGKSSLTIGTGIQAGGNFLSTGTGLPLPQIEGAYRRGLRPNLDAGARLWLLGTGVDLRYRFVHEGPWHVAFAPGIGGTWLPLDARIRGFGTIDLRLPVIAERELAGGWSVAGGPVALAHNQMVAGGEGENRVLVERLELFTGGAGRLRATWGRGSVGFGGDLLYNANRGGHLAWTAGADVTWQRRERRGKDR